MAAQTAHSNSPLLTKPEAADYLRISIRKLDYLVAAGDIAPTRIDGRVLFSRSELDRYIVSRTAPVRVPEMVGALATA